MPSEPMRLQILEALQTRYATVIKKTDGYWNNIDSRNISPDLEWIDNIEDELAPRIVMYPGTEAADRPVMKAFDRPVMQVFVMGFVNATEKHVRRDVERFMDDVRHATYDSNLSLDGLVCDVFVIGARADLGVQSFPEWGAFELEVAVIYDYLHAVS